MILSDLGVNKIVIIAINNPGDLSALANVTQPGTVIDSDFAFSQAATLTEQINDAICSEISTTISSTPPLSTQALASTSTVETESTTAVTTACMAPPIPTPLSTAASKDLLVHRYVIVISRLSNEHLRRCAIRSAEFYRLQWYTDTYAHRLRHGRRLSNESRQCDVDLH